jgi:hypothetical protein
MAALDRGSQWQSVLQRGRRYLADAQVPLKVQLTDTFQEATLEGDLPFTFVKVGDDAPCLESGGIGTKDGEEDDEDEDKDGEDEDKDSEDEDKDGEDEDKDSEDEDKDAGNVVTSVAFTLLNTAARDTTSDIKERCMAAVLQAILDVFFFSHDNSPHKSQPAVAVRSQPAVALRISTVGNGAMALALSRYVNCRLGSNDVRIAQAEIVLFQQVAAELMLRILRRTAAQASSQ